MLRDFNNRIGDAELSLNRHYAKEVLLRFIDNTISGFRKYYFSISLAQVHENAITSYLVTYFNAQLNDSYDGFIPFNFEKNSPQIGSRKETDIGVVILNKSTYSPPILEFEAKRLSKATKNHEYVYGYPRGGIERFKLREHGALLDTCGMFGYVQDYDCAGWLTQINSWIKQQAEKPSFNLDWREEKELLVHVAAFKHAIKCQSVNLRIDASDMIIYHYLIDLTSS